MKILASCAIFASLAANSVLAADSNPAVKVAAGQLAGRTISAGGATFKGIPFAQPPVGDLRWHEPVAVKSWSGTRDAGEFGKSCVQQISGWNSQEAQGNQEDCLYLNIWTPEWPMKSAKPVMVWLHGGGNTGGGASVDYFDGTSLSRKGVVIVTINYRLGLFGFFSHPGLTAESSHHASGNYGLLDQVAALKWVQANISKFGGDPKNVTIFGQSAGAIDIGYLLASPLSKGVITKAIQESGPPIREYPVLAKAEQSGEKFAESLKASGPGAIKTLRAMSATDLQKAAVAARGASGPTMGPIIDGYSLPQSPVATFAAGHELTVPLIIGNQAREQGGPNNPDDLRKQIATNFGSNAAKAEEFYGVANGGKGTDDPLFGPAGIAFSADTRFRCGSIGEALWHTAAKQTTYEYQFDLPTAGKAAASHSSELEFVFGNLLPAGFLGGPYTENDHKVSETIQTYWTNFAKTGNPNGSGLPEWPKFDPSSRPYLEFTAAGPVIHEGLRRNICDLFIETVKQEQGGHAD
jgi:para-nitrobenzyl esterase